MYQQDYLQVKTKAQIDLSNMMNLEYFVLKLLTLSFSNKFTGQLCTFMIAQCRYFMPFLSQKLNDDRFVMSIITESAPKSNGTTSKYNNISIYNSYLIEARKGDDGQDL